MSKKRSKKKYVSKGERRSVAKWITKAMKRDRTSIKEERQLDAFLDGKPTSEETKLNFRRAMSIFKMPTREDNENEK